jgi:hypothetical protein
LVNVGPGIGCRGQLLSGDACVSPVDEKQARINIPGAYKLAAEQKSALIVFFADDAISGLRGWARIVSTSDLMPKQRRAAVDSRQVIYQLPIEGLPDSHTDKYAHD